MQQTNKQQQQLQKQDGEQVEEDEPQTGTMTHHNELARKGTKTVHSNWSTDPPKPGPHLLEAVYAPAHQTASLPVFNIFLPNRVLIYCYIDSNLVT
jgi:hypothetical protein